MRSDTQTSKGARFDARLTADQKSLFERAAALAGSRTLTDFVLDSAQEKAEAVIRESEILHLSEKNRQIFVDALLHPPAPNRRLKQAASRYKKLRRNQ